MLMGAACKSLGLSNLIIGGLIVSRISFGGPLNANRVLLLQDVSDLLLYILVAEPIMVGVRVDSNAPPWSGALSVVDAAVEADMAGPARDVIRAGGSRTRASGIASVGVVRPPSPEHSDCPVSVRMLSPRPW